jgi:8-oxo-dGTP pyrophosphatase MutT (NUDIX family)
MSAQPPPMVRPIAIGVVRDGDRLLVAQGMDAAKGNQVFYRPLGGSIEFGEAAAETVRREFAEEMGAEVVVGRLLGVLENRFVLEGAPGHEIVLVFETTLADASLADRDAIDGVEEGGIPFVARWMPIAGFVDGGPPLYPDGLRELLEAAAGITP